MHSIMHSRVHHSNIVTRPSPPTSSVPIPALNDRENNTVYDHLMHGQHYINLKRLFASDNCIRAVMTGDSQDARY